MNTSGAISNMRASRMRRTFQRGRGGVGAAAAPTLADVIAATYPSDMIAYLKFNESSGTTANDYSGNDNDATYAANGVTLAAVGVGDGNTAATFDGSAGYVNLAAAAGFVSGFNGDLGAVGIWLKADAAFWASATTRWALWIESNSDANSWVRIGKVAANQLQFGRRNGAGSITSVTHTFSPAPADTWFLASMNWDASTNVQAFVNGASVGTSTTGLGAWTATGIKSDRARVMGRAASNDGWLGQGAHFVIYGGRKLLAADWLAIYGAV